MCSYNLEGIAVPVPHAAIVVMTNKAHPFTFDDLKRGIKFDLSYKGHTLEK